MANWLSLWEDYNYYNSGEVTDKEREAWNEAHSSEMEKLFAVSN